MIRNLRAAIVGVLTAAFLAAAQGANAGTVLTGVVAPPAAITPKDGAFALLLIQPASATDKAICSYFATRYGTARGSSSARDAYGLYWLAPSARGLSEDDCRASPPPDRLPDGVYNYPAAPAYKRQLRLPRAGPYLVVVKCDPDGSPINLGYVDLGRSPNALAEKFDAFEEYVSRPQRWSKMRIIDRDLGRYLADFIQTPQRVGGRAVGLIKPVKDCQPGLTLNLASP